MVGADLHLGGAGPQSPRPAAADGSDAPFWDEGTSGASPGFDDSFGMTSATRKVLG